MTNSPMPGMSRRTFLQVSAAGVVTATALGRIGRANAAAYSQVHLDLAARHARGARRLSATGSARRWAISPTRRRDRHAARPVGRHRDGEVRRCRPGRHGLPVAGRVLVRARERHEAEVRLPLGRARHVQPRLPQGRRHQRPQDARGQDHPARLGRLAVDRRSDAGRAGRRHHQGEVCRGRLADLGHGAGRRPGRRGARAGRACVPSGSAAASTSNTGSACSARRSLPTPTSCAPPTSRIPTRRPSSTSTCAAGRWASSSPTTTRWPRWKPCSSSSRRWPPTSGRSSAPLSILQQINVVRGDMYKRKGWGDHDMAAWQTFFDKIYDAGPDHQADQGRGRLHQRLHRAGQRLRPRQGQGRRRRLQAQPSLRGDRCRERQGAPLRPGRAGLIDGTQSRRGRRSPPPAHSQDKRMGRAGWPIK